MTIIKKIAFLTLSLTKGGAERVIANLCNEALIDRYQVTVIMCMKAKVEYQLDEKIQRYTLDKDEEQWKENQGRRFLRRQKELKRFLIDYNPDLVISFLPEPNFLALSLRKTIKCPTIISVRNDPVREYKGKVKQLLMRHYYPMADAYVFQTKQAAEYFLFSDHIKENSNIIPNPLGREFLSSASDVSRIQAEEQGEKRIVNIGRLEKQKDQKKLIEAFDSIADQFPDWNLYIYGEGSLRGQLNEQIINCERNNRIFLCGNVDDIHERLAEADLFALSSVYEGMPNALIEAMATGIPVVSTDCPCGGPAALITNGVNGRLVPNQCTSTEIADCMSQLMNNPKEAEKLGLNALDIRKALHPDKIYGIWIDLIEKIIKN